MIVKFNYYGGKIRVLKDSVILQIYLNKTRILIYSFKEMELDTRYLIDPYLSLSDISDRWRKYISEHDLKMNVQQLGRLLVSKGVPEETIRSLFRVTCSNTSCYQPPIRTIKFNYPEIELNAGEIGKRFFVPGRSTLYGPAYNGLHSPDDEAKWCHEHDDLPERLHHSVLYCSCYHQPDSDFTEGFHCAGCNRFSAWRNRPNVRRRIVEDGGWGPEIYCTTDCFKEDVDEPLDYENFINGYMDGLLDMDSEVGSLDDSDDDDDDGSSK